MVEWDKVDLLTCFEADPEVGEDGLSYRYQTERSGYRLTLEFFPYDGDVHVLLHGSGQQLPLAEVWLHNCHAIRYERDGAVEVLHFVNRDFTRSQVTTFECMQLRVRPEFVVDITR